MTPTELPYTEPLMEGTETTIEPLHLSITTTWPEGGRHNIHLLDNPDLGANVQEGHKADGAPRRYGVEQGMVLVLLGLDNDHDEVHVNVTSSVGMIEALRMTMEVVHRSLKALEKVTDSRI